MDGSLDAKGTAADTAAANTNSVTSTVASGDIGKSTIQAATQHVYDGKKVTAVTADGTLDVEYMDTDGSMKKVTLSIANGDDAAKIKAKIETDDTLGKLFEVTVDTTASSEKFQIKAKNPGKSEVHVTKLTANATALAFTGTASDITEGKDAAILLEQIGSNKTDNSAGGANIKDGTTLTIGDKPYEILSDISKVKEGNIAVKLDGTSTYKNLQDALKQNGISSAKLYTDNPCGTEVATAGTDAKVLRIEDLSEIQGAQNGNVSMASDAAGVVIENTTAAAGIYTVTAKAGSAAGNYTTTVEYLDENGAKQSKDINYELKTVALANSDVSAALAKAMKDGGLGDLFKIEIDATNAEKIHLTAKTAGTNGARLIGLKNKRRIRQPTAWATWQLHRLPRILGQR